MKDELIVGGIGTGMSVLGTATQTNEVLQTISLVVTIVGAVISMIVVPLISWWQKAKKDGKITKEEIQEGIEIISDGLESLKDKDKEDK